MNKPSKSFNPIVWLTYVLLLMLPEMLMLNTHTWWDAPVSTAFNIVYCKRIRDASIYTSKKISLKLLFLSDIFLFPFIRQQVTVLA